MTRPATANDVVLQLAQLGRDIDANVSALQSAEMEAVNARHEADLAYARAFLGADTGSVEHRKHAAFLACDRVELAAATAEAVVRHLRRRSQAITTRVDIGRSYNSALKAEAALAGRDGQT